MPKRGKVDELLKLAKRQHRRRDPETRWKIFFDAWLPDELRAYHVFYGDGDDTAPNKAYMLRSLTLPLFGTTNDPEAWAQYPPPFRDEAEVRAVADRIQAAMDAELEDSMLPVDDAFRARYPAVMESAPSYDLGGVMRYRSDVPDAEMAAYKAKYRAWLAARRAEYEPKREPPLGG